MRYRQGAAGSHHRAGVSAGCKGESRLSFTEPSWVAGTPEPQLHTTATGQTGEWPCREQPSGVTVSDADFGPLQRVVHC